jgi:LPXTG-motif cell wall-anchored protein
MHSVASGQSGQPPAPQGRQRPLFPELRELAGSGDFEGHVSFGLGLKAKTGYRAFVLTNPDRLVVDVRIAVAASPTPAAAATAAPGSTSGQLAATGSAAGWTAVAGASLLLLGGMAHLLSRRRPHRISA